MPRKYYFTLPIHIQPVALQEVTKEFVILDQADDHIQTNLPSQAILYLL